MRGEVDARSAAGEGAYPQKQATSSRFYDPGASPLPFFFPGTNPGERSAAGRFRLYVIRTASRQAANPSARAACDLVLKRTTPAHSPGGAPYADKLAPSALLLRRFLSPDRFRYTGDAQDFAVRSFRPWRPAMAGSP